jgi:putative phosphoesterase
MRLAIISDIHGNLVALEAVLADIERQHCDQIICLGDVVEDGPHPRECLHRIHALGCETVMGNTDERMLKFHGQTPDSSVESVSYQRNFWSANQLDHDDCELIKSFKPFLKLELGGLNLIACHGSPKSNTDPIVQSTSSAELDAFFAGHNADLFVGGHTHRPFCINHFEARVINPGSVGLPYRVPATGFTGKYPKNIKEFRPFLAEYAMLEVREDGVGVDLRQVKVDPGLVRESVLRSAMPGKSEWLAEWMLNRGLE